MQIFDDIIDCNKLIAFIVTMHLDNKISLIYTKFG